MRNHPHLRNLRRIFGGQPVGCVGNQSRPEAGIAAQIIPAQSSGWTVRGQGDVHWRLGDLPTLVVDDSWGDRSRTLFRRQLRRFLHLQHQRRRFRLKPRFPSAPSIPKPEELSKRLLRRHCSASFISRQAPITNSNEEPKVAPRWIRILGIDCK
jgi:hypothetical protein